jgi:hypothetical protein
MEVPVQHVGRNVEVMIAVSGSFVFTGSDDARTVADAIGYERLTETFRSEIRELELQLQDLN